MGCVEKKGECEMEDKELKKVLDSHKKWLAKEDGGVRADLRDAYLRGADLRGADLRDAYLRHADLRDADLDYSAWPLWCGSLDAYIDDSIAIQLLYHLLRPVQASPYVSQEVKDRLLTDDLIDLANRFRRIYECGEVRR